MSSHLKRHGQFLALQLPLGAHLDFMVHRFVGVAVVVEGVREGEGQDEQAPLPLSDVGQVLDLLFQPCK